MKELVVFSVLFVFFVFVIAGVAIATVQRIACRGARRNKEKPGVHSCNLSSAGVIGRRISVQGHLAPTPTPGKSLSPSVK
jgi:hypothetical protein